MDVDGERADGERDILKRMRTGLDREEGRLREKVTNRQTHARSAWLILRHHTRDTRWDTQ
jgi:hypothetical protein